MTQSLVTANTVIHAPLDRVFALSTRVELVQKTLGMRPASGVTQGHVVAESRVVWRGWKFGLPTEHHTLITAYEAPHRETDGTMAAFFEDSQERGRFASFRHEHFFRERDGVAELEDRIHFMLPFGRLGRAASRWLLAPYIRGLARARFAMIRELAEGEGWREWVDETRPNRI